MDIELGNKYVIIIFDECIYFFIKKILNIYHLLCIGIKRQVI